MKLENKKKLAMIGSYAGLAVALIALLLAIAATLPHTFGWFAHYLSVSATNANIVFNGDQFDIAITDDLTTMYTAESDARIANYLINSDHYDKIAQTAGPDTGLFYFLSGITDGEISPGSKGDLLFYIIPKDDAITSLTVTLNLTGVTGTTTLSHTTDADALDLLKGHVLFYFDRTTVNPNAVTPYYTYENRVDGSFEYVLADHSSETIQINGRPAYPVHLYWVWPSTFAQMALSEGDPNLHGHAIFEDLTGTTDEIDNIHALMSDHPEYFFHSNDPAKDGAYYTALFTAFETNFTVDRFAELSEGYNNGDQKIGEEVQYFAPLFEIEASFG